MQRRGPRLVVALLAAAAGVLVAWPAMAQKPVSQTGEYSRYEKEAIKTALEDGHLEIDPDPEGKTIGTIHAVRLEVLEPRDPGPELLRPVPIISPLTRVITKERLNWLHVVSRAWIIRREFLLTEGEPYVQVVVDETARNIRSRMPLQVSLVIILPVKSSNGPGYVDLLVITKDIWSLRLSFDVVGTSGGLEKFTLVPQETNFLGLHHTVRTSYVYQPKSHTLGVGYSIPRFGQSWIGAGASATITLNRDTGRPEGSSMGISTGQGLYSTRTEWAWDADASYSVGVTRTYSNAHVLLFDSRRTPDERERIPVQYRSSSRGASVSVTRSFGWAFKNNFSLGFNASRSEYSAFEDQLAGVNPIAAEAFRTRYLPTGEARVYPSFSWATFQTNFLRTLDINTLSLQEDYRLGHNVSATVYPVMRALGSSRDFVGVSAKAGYAVALGDGLAGASVSTFAENKDGIITDGSVGGSFGAVTPRIFGLGRIAMNTSFTNRYKNYLNSYTNIGGEDRLRGYPTSFFSGKDTVFFNIEYRSRSVELLKAQIGGVLFFDAGDAAFGLDKIRPKQSVGFGFRTLFPQINRLVLRVDFAFPLQRGPFPEAASNQVVPPFGFFFAFDQAFAP